MESKKSHIISADACINPGSLKNEPLAPYVLIDTAVMTCVKVNDNCWATVFKITQLGQVFDYGTILPLSGHTPQWILHIVEKLSAFQL